jgi:hypothetical protein
MRPSRGRRALGKLGPAAFVVHENGGRNEPRQPANPGQQPTHPGHVGQQKPLFLNTLSGESGVYVDMSHAPERKHNTNLYRRFFAPAALDTPDRPRKAQQWHGLAPVRGWVQPRTDAGQTTATPPDGGPSLPAASGARRGPVPVELAPILAAYPGATVEIRPATPLPPAPVWPPKPRLPHDWHDLDGWRAVLRYARTVEHRRWVVTRWAKAAGGCIRDGALHLPAGLPRGLALAELKTHARIAGLEVEV